MACCILGCPNNTIRGNKESTYHLFPHPIKERYRHAQWIEACNNPKLFDKDPMRVYKSLRVCRRHFAADCFNGACRRILATAVPTLHINKDIATDTQLRAKRNVLSDSVLKRMLDTDFALIEDEEFVENDSVAATASTNEVVYPVVEEEETADKPSELVDLFDDLPVVEVEEDENVENDNDDFDMDNSSDQVKQDYSECADYGHGQKTQKVEPIARIEDQHVVNAKVTDDSYELIEVLDEECFIPYSIEDSDWLVLRQKFYKNPKNMLAQTASAKIDPLDVCANQESLHAIGQNFFNFDVAMQTIKHQKCSNNVWLFSALQCIRLPFAKHYDLIEFEFSQAYLVYWDKIERCNFYLNKIAEMLLKGEEFNGQLISFLLKNPINDSGRWIMLKNLIEKYGLMPAKLFPKTYSSENSHRLNQMLNCKLRENIKVLRILVGDHRSERVIRSVIKEQMIDLYNIVGICLGVPPVNFVWEYYDANRKYNRAGSYTPKAFYEECVKVCFDIGDKMVIANDPRPDHSYGKLFAFEHLGNVVGKNSVQYNNQSAECLLAAAVDSIKRNELVWCACDLTKGQSASVLDVHLHKHAVAFGVPIGRSLCKADRLVYGDARMTNVLVLTAVQCANDGKPEKFRAQNFSQNERTEDGDLIMTAEWFLENVFEIVVDQSVLDRSVLKAFEKKISPAWDAMGFLID